MSEAPPDPPPTPGPASSRQGSSGSVRSRAELAAAALAVGKTVKAAAKASGYSERSIYRNLRKTKFRQRVEAIRETLVAEAVGLTTKNMAAAAEVLRKLLRSKSEAIRLRSAKALIELGVELREHGELARRLAELEERMVEGTK
jgi:hypothetical protein